MNLKNPVDVRVTAVILVTNIIMGFMTFAFYNEGLYGEFKADRLYFENGVIQNIYRAAIILSIVMIVMSILLIVL